MAFPADGVAWATPASNRAAFNALAMVVIDKRVGELARVDASLIDACSLPPSSITLHGRSDLPTHGTLSAALTAGAGARLAGSMGEWKELADSLSGQPGFRQDDPTGCSFLDLLADRAGAARPRSHFRTPAPRCPRDTYPKRLTTRFCRPR